MIPPGETIGILGGGQLGRMLAMAAAQLGYRAHVYAPEADSIAAEVCGGFTCAGWYDAEALAKFARDCAVITYEFENVPVAPLAALGEARVLPNHPRHETRRTGSPKSAVPKVMAGCLRPMPRSIRLPTWMRQSRKSAHLVS